MTLQEKTTQNDDEKKSIPEKIAAWLFKVAASWRGLLGFGIVASLTYISVRFNYQLGLLSGVDEISRSLLPAGYALLDLAGLFLSGYVGLKSISFFRRFLAWSWFGLLLSLSLWAAASFTLSVDHRAANVGQAQEIEQQKFVVQSANFQVATWQESVQKAVNYKSKHQATLDQKEAEQAAASARLSQLEASAIPSTMAIYAIAAPFLGLTPEALALIIRLLWAFALTITPLLIVFLICAETIQASKKAPPKKKATLPTASRIGGFFSQMPAKIQRFKDKRKLHRILANISTPEHTEKKPTLRATSGTHGKLPAALTEKKGNNQHTEAIDLRAFEAASKWLATQEGRVNRAEIGKACGLHDRAGVSKIIAALIDSKQIERLSNGQLSKPQKAHAG